MTLASGAPAEDGAGLLALVGATVVGQSKLGPATVMIRDGRIEKVGPQADVTVPEDCDRMELTGKFLIPGLVDLASECVDADCLGLNLYFGVTTLRTVGGLEPALVQELTRGPRVIPAALLEMANGPPGGALAISGAEQLDEELPKLVEQGYHWVIAEPAVGPEVLVELAQKGKALGLKVGARLGATGLDAALGMKLDSLEHVTSLLTTDLTLTPFAFQKDAVGLYTKYVVPQAGILGLEEKLQDGAWRPAGKAKVAVVPALASIEYPVQRRPPQLQKLPGALQKEPERYGNTSIALRNAFELMLRVARAASEAGAVIGVGSRAPGLMNVPGYAVHREMELLVKAGWTPAAALEAATSTGASILGLTDVGKIQAGMAADLVVLAADPTGDITATQQIEQVLVAGQALERDALLLGGRGGGAERLGAPWTAETILTFDEQSLGIPEKVFGEVFPAEGTGLPKTRFIQNDEGYYVRVSGRLQASEEAGLRLNFSSDAKRPWDMASYSGAVLRVRGNNQQFWLRVRTLGVQDEDYFSATFLAEEDWTSVQIPWSTLRQSGKGRQLSYHGRDVLGFDIYTRARGQDLFYQLDLDDVGLFE